MGGHTIRFILFILTSAFFLLSISSNDVFSQATENPVSPSRNIHHKPERGKERKSKNLPDGYRTIDGSGNNLSSLEMGSSFSRLLRLVSSDYSDSISELSGKNRSSARKISNIVASQDELIPNEHQATDYLWQWGQFLDHDIDLTDGTQPPEKENILVPAGDKYFDPESTGTEIIEFNRSLYDKNTGTGIDNPREQLNEITAWIDASNIYGSNTERANALRANDGSGRMKMQDNLLTFNTLGLPNAGGEGENLFISGDVRANEQVALTAMHTLFSREHNRLADIIAEENPDYTGDEIYEKARKIVGAEMQVITYNEFLPSLLGDGRLSDYNGYNPNINSDIMNEFSTAAYRFGHSALSPTLLRLNKEMEVIQQGNLPLRNAFFSPARIVEEGGIDPLLRGLSA
ncbi:MAG: peroxiredoxin, partial [Candidatus Dadabacteria bacterium]|nr:peroxiredoxin [Candidatus Dadabacteria bacterium]NIQ15489.1 peroxiredoxin [Candidatus Dadabacteria bacterium]